jgi:hypothetical protein
MVTEYELTYINKYHKDNLNNSIKYNATTKGRAADSSKQLKAQHNLQKSKEEPNKCLEEETLSYSVPTIMNGQILRTEKERSTTPQDELSECVC